MLAGLLVESGEARDVHHMCTLLGYGADSICPYLAMEAIVALQEDGKVDGRASRLDLINNYIKVDISLCLVSVLFSLYLVSVCLVSCVLRVVSSSDGAPHAFVELAWRHKIWQIVDTGIQVPPG